MEKQHLFSCSFTYGCDCCSYEMRQVGRAAGVPEHCMQLWGPGWGLLWTALGPRPDEPALTMRPGRESHSVSVPAGASPGGLEQITRRSLIMPNKQLLCLVNWSFHISWLFGKSMICYVYKIEMEWWKQNWLIDTNRKHYNIVFYSLFNIFSKEVFTLFNLKLRCSDEWMNG